MRNVMSSKLAAGLLATIMCANGTQVLPIPGQWPKSDPCEAVASNCHISDSDRSNLSASSVNPIICSSTGEMWVIIGAGSPNGAKRP